MTDKVRQLLEQVADELRKHQNEDATNLIDRIDEILTPEEISVEEESTKSPNNMRCCRCKLSKKPWEIICDCCGGSTYEGFYDKELDECEDEGKPIEGVKLSEDGFAVVNDDPSEKPVEEMTTKELIESPSEERTE